MRPTNHTVSCWIFFAISAEQAEALRQRIEKNKGLIRIFVHPFFETTEKFTPPERTQERARRIARGIEKWLRLPPEKTPPIFFFEEELEVDAFKKRLGEFANSAYVVPTSQSDPMPKFPRSFSHPKKSVSETEWEYFNRRLQELGVKRIILGGQLLQVGRLVIPVYSRSQRLKGWRRVLRRCVGTAANHLSDDFTVELSSLNSPETRVDVKRVEALLARAQELALLQTGAAREEYDKIRDELDAITVPAGSYSDLSDTSDTDTRSRWWE